MKNSALKKTLAVIFFGVLGAGTPTASFADLEGVMERAFNSEMNVTSSGAYMGARRGAVSFGRVRIANNISSPTLVSFTPPGIKAGCGGIDMWGGSFSFISGKQLEALGKNIASNAMGYAFELALSNFPDGKNAIQTMRNIVNAINKMSLDSCTAARNIVDAVTGRNNKANTDAGLIGAGDGTFSDFFASITSPNGAIGKVSKEQLKKRTEFKPNPIWHTIKTAGVAGWFPGGNNDFAHSIMSMTGALIMQKKEANPDDPESEEEVIATEYIAPTLDVYKLVEGGLVEIITCNNDDCDDTSVSTIKLNGFYYRIFNALAKDGGILDKLYTGTDPFTDDEQKLLKALKPNVGWAINDLSRSHGAAKEYISIITEVAAFQTACDLSKEMMNSVEIALTAQSIDGKMEIFEKLAEAKQNLFRDCRDAKAKISDTASTFQLSTLLMDQIRKKQ